MSEFETVLRHRVTTIYRELDAARRAGDDYEIELHAARLEQLLDLAARSEVDVASLVELDIPRQGRG